MARYKFIVFSNAAEGREAEFNRWYDEVHLGEVLEVPGFTGASRLEIPPDAEGNAPEYRYVAIYEMECGDPGAVLAELTARAGDGRIRMSDALGDVATRLCREITPLRQA